MCVERMLMEKPTQLDPFVRMRKILDEHPDLGFSGFRVRDFSDSKFVEDRRELLDDMWQVHKAMTLLEVAPRTKTCQVNSYELKHTLERWMSLRNGQHEYFSNGAVILACLLLDIAIVGESCPRVLRKDRNVEVGISSMWHMGVRMVIEEWSFRKA
jgi:hypothetical protein